MSSPLSRAALRLGRGAGRFPPSSPLSSAASSPLRHPAGAVRACSQCHSVKEWKENHGAWSRTPSTTTAHQQTRACSQCHSVKEWKENHGAWSRAPPATTQQQSRTYATEGRSLADEKIEEITELFNTARDEFELAMEETEKKTVYAADDRTAAQEEFARMQEAYAAALSEMPAEVGAEIQRRIGARVRELEAGMARLEQLAMED